MSLNEQQAEWFRILGAGADIREKNPIWIYRISSYLTSVFKLYDPHHVVMGNVVQDG